MEIHERLKLIRQHFKMSQEEFGEALGVSRSMVANIEYGRLKRPEQKESLYRLVCREFNVNEEWLRTGHGEMFLELTREQEIAELTYSLFKDEKDSFKSRFISALSKLDVKDWEVLEKLVLSIVENKKD